MNPDAIAQYLQHNPKFFEDYADLMAQIFVPHPHGGRTVSLPERQMLTLRDKNKALEHSLAELVAAGHANDGLSTKMHRLTLALLRLPKESPERIIETLNYHLREDFAVPHTSLKVWGVRADHQAFDDTQALSPALRELAASPTLPQQLPYCGPVAKLRHEDRALGDEVALWFGDAAPHIKSLAVMSLISVHTEAGGAGGLLALASEDEQRFYAGMGTLYLERLAELVSAALAHIFP